MPRRPREIDSEPPPTSDAGPGDTGIDPELGFPPPGEVLRRLRTRRGWSLRDVARESGLSQSFLGAVERGESDIALERLARLARVFDHDVGSFLGYSARRSTPTFIGEDERVVVDRGDGIDYEIIRLPGLGFELVQVTLAPRAGFSSELAHEGVDVTLVIDGTIVAVYHGVDYQLAAGTCVMWSGGYPHRFRNDSRRPARYVGFVTAQVF